MDNLEQALLESENSLMLLSDEELITPINDMLIINPETRLIEVPNTELLLGVFSENLVEKKYFKCPRIVLNNIDLYECFIFINYVSANGRIGSIQSENVELDETEQYILFDWDLTSNVFDKNKDSTIYFSVSAKQYLEDSEPVFATRKAQGKMYETINGTEYITQEHADIILQILAGMKTKVDLPKDEDGNLLVPEEGQTLLFKEDGTTYYGTPSSGGGTSFSGSAKDVTYDDTETKLGAENVQDAIGKLSEDITIEVEYDFLLLYESDGVNSSYLDVGVDVEVGDVLKCVTPRVDGKNLDDRIDIYTSVDGVDKYQSLEFPIIKDVFGETPITEVELIVEITEEVTSIRVHENTTVYKREEITIGKKVSSIETELIKVQKEKADKKDIPTKTSQLKNDSNFVTTENIDVCVKLTFENGLYVTDKTYEEIVEFYNNGYSPYVVLDNNVFRLYKVNESSFEFAYCQVGTVEVMIDKVIITNNNINIVQSSTEILKEISKQSHWRFEKVDSIPVNDASYNVIYLVQRFDEDNHVKGNIYDEYIFLKDGNRYELIGSTDIDLSNVYQKSETYSKEEVNALVKAVSDAVIALQSKVPSKTSQLTDDVGFAKQTVVDGLQEEIADLDISKVEQSDLENEVADQLDGMKVDIVQEILTQINGNPSPDSNSVFGKVYDDGKIVITTDLAVGTYILGFEDADGNFTEAGSLMVIGEATTFSITRVLDGCTSNKTDTSVINGDSYSETITLNGSHVLSSATVTMGGVDITSSVYNNGQITIPSVTGDIIITVSARAIPDLVPSAKNFDGTILDGIGYRRGSYVSSSGASLSEFASATAIGMIPVTNGVAHDIYVYGLDLTGTKYNRLAVYNYSSSAGTYSFVTCAASLKDGSTVEFVASVTKLADNYYKITTNTLSSKIDYFAVSGITVAGIVPMVTVDTPIF